MRQRNLSSCSVLTGNKFALDAVIHVLKFGCTKNVVYLAFLSAEMCYMSNKNV